MSAKAVSTSTSLADSHVSGLTSLDASRLVYSAWDPFNTTMHIFSARADGSRMQRLTSAPNVRDVEPVWSPDGRRIAFNRSEFAHPTGPGILVMAVDGTDRRRVASGVFDLATWSPTGTRLLATADGALPYHIVIIRLDGLMRTVKVPQPDPRADAWSPSGDVIVYSAARNRLATSYNLYSVHLDGTPANRLTDGHGLDYDASYSPSGRRIVYTHANAGRTSHMFIMKADGTAPHQVTFGRLEPSAPHFTCNGAWIIFTAGTEPDALRAYAVRPDGTRLHPLNAAMAPLTSDPRPVC